jgi:uncharacterized membrane-anchored protein YjiN (DUF445 family)
MSAPTVSQEANPHYRAWIEKNTYQHPSDRRWRYLTVRTGWLFGKERKADQVIEELQRLRTDWSHHVNRDTQRWTYYFRAHLSEDEHAAIARKVKAKERPR